MPRVSRLNVDELEDTKKCPGSQSCPLLLHYARPLNTYPGRAASVIADKILDTKDLTPRKDTGLVAV